MNYYNSRFEKTRQEMMTAEKIVTIAHRSGSFEVSLRYRDDWLRKRCRKLRRKGLLRGGHRVIKGRLIFYPVETIDGPDPRPEADQQVQGGRPQA